MTAHKINEKWDKYTDLKIEVQRMWNVRAVVVPLVNGTLGSVSVCLAENLHTLNIFYRTLIPKLYTKEHPARFLSYFEKIFNRTSIT